MPAQEIARQWFIPGDGIDRHVISADIQRYLGNDATVRPGQGTGENQGVNGYWIKAYRNLTSAMIADLRADSQRWRQEQRMTGTREPYVGSNTYQASSAATAARANRRDGDSPSLDGPYGVPPGRAADRRQPVDPMQIDMPTSGSSRDPRYAQPTQPGRGYERDARGYQPDQPRYGERSQFPQDQTMTDAYARVPVTSSYGQDSRYAPSGFPQPNDGPAAGYSRGAGGNYFVGTSSYDIPPNMATSRDAQQFPTGMYGGPQQPPYREARDPRDDRQRDPRDPRFAQQDFDPRDPRNAYPSPATTVASVPRDREAPFNPTQNIYGGSGQPSVDQYGRAIQNPPNPYGQEPGYPSSGREPSYGRERPAPAPAGGDARRRRH